jgi:hypothetical protein
MANRWAVLLALLLAGCGGDEGEDETGSPASSGAAGEGGTVVVRATYTGTPRSTGTGALFACLYKTLSTAQALPEYRAQTPAEAAVGTEYTLTLEQVAPGDYYLLVFYDFQQHNQHDAGRADRYVLYEGQHLAAGAAAIAVRSGQTATPAALRFGDEFQLGLGGAYQ